MFLMYVALTFAVMVLLCLTSPAHGWRLWTAVGFLAWSVGQLNTLIEAVVFKVMPLHDMLLQLAISAGVIAILSGLALLLAGRVRGTSEALVRPAVSLRNLALILLGYQLLYWSAGTLVWPFVADYYTAKGLPPALLVAALQLPRALIFVAAVWPWLRTNPRHAPLLLGIAFAVLGGIAPALPENPYMPEHVRFAHAFETGGSNFLFGLLMGCLLLPPKRTKTVAVPASR